MKSILTKFKVNLVTLTNILKEWIRLKWGNPFYRYSIFAFLFFAFLGSSLPVLFRKPLALRVINTIDIDIIEQVNFSGVDFSLFRSFPFLNVRFSNFTTLGSKALGNSELLSVKYIDIAVDIWSVIDKSRPIYIRSIRFYEPKLTLLISSSGQKNYEIPLAEEFKESRDSFSKAKINFNLALQSIEIINGFLFLEDENAKVNIKADGISHKGSGDLSTSFYNLKTKTRASEVSISIGSSQIMENAKLLFDVDFNIDNINKIYVIKENDIQINQLSLQIKGLIKKNPTNYYYDLNLYAPDNQFSELVQLLPSLEKTSFRQLKQIKGDFNLGLNIKGPFQVSPRVYPNFNGFLQINNGSILDYFNSEGISDIQSYLSICNDSNNLENLEIYIPKMEACMEGKDFNLALYLRNPFYNPYVNGFIRGELQLSSLQKYLPVFSGSDLRGLVTANLFMQGKMSDIDDKNYDNVKMDGELTLKDFKWTESNKWASIQTLSAVLSREGLTLPLVKGNYNGNPLTISGRFTNILAFFSPLKTLKGSFNVSADKTNINYWIVSNDPRREKTTLKQNNYNKEVRIESEIRSPELVPYDVNIQFKTSKLLYKGTSFENFNLTGNYKRNSLLINNLRFKYQNLNIRTKGNLLNLDNYLFDKGVLKGNLNIWASQFPFILPSSDLLAQSASKGVVEESKPSLINKIIPIIGKKVTPPFQSLVPDRIEISGKVYMDSIKSAEQIFNNIAFQLRLKKEIVELNKGIAYHKNMPIYWQGNINKQNNFVVKFDLSKFQMNLFSLPKQSPLQIFNFTTIDKKNKPAGLKLTGNIGNAPDYPFSSLKYLFYFNMNGIISGTQIKPFNGLHDKDIENNKNDLNWWISYEDKKFIFWPIFLTLKDIPFYFTGLQSGDKECYFKVKGLIPLSYFKMEEFTTNDIINSFPNGIEVTIDIEDCISKNFSVSLQIQPSLNEILRLKLEKYLKYELNKELRRIYAEDKLRNIPKKSIKDRYHYLPALYQQNNQNTWIEFYKLNDSLQSSFKSMKPFFK
ncbi:MAG: hypothetical protein NWS66_13505 [Saprospiraceae bacterium]|nr:hypothetical protein [Saprospiraceae bacterium]MDP4813411.1 hypothetical protein [Saprospiraceae bacterium]